MTVARLLLGAGAALAVSTAALAGGGNGGGIPGSGPWESGAWELATWPGVTDPVQARTDYQLKCQGCHRPDGSGDNRSNPPMRGIVAKFLTVPGGREFIGRVPGVATADLSDARLTNLVNWTLHRFDRAHLPAGFRPYTVAEIARLRARPLRLERAAMRADLVKAFDRQ